MQERNSELRHHSLCHGHGLPTHTVITASRFSVWRHSVAD